MEIEWEEQGALDQGFLEFSNFLLDIEQDFPNKMNYQKVSAVLRLCNQVIGNQHVMENKNYLRAFMREIFRKVYTKVFDNGNTEMDVHLVALESNLRAASFTGLQEEILERKHDLLSHNLLVDSVKYFNLSSFYIQKQKYEKGLLCAKKSLKILEAKVLLEGNFSVLHW